MLPNGLEVIVFADAIVPLVTAELVIKAGSSYETPTTSGYAHLYEHLFWPDERAKAPGAPSITNRGISFNAATREESVNFYLVAPAAGLTDSLRYLQAAALNPDFGNARLAAQAEMVLAEIGRAQANPYEAMRRRTMEILFPQNPTFKSPLGSASAVSGATPGRLRALHARFMHPGNAALIVTGDAEPEAVFRQAAEIFGAWARPAQAEVMAAADPGPPPRRSAAEIIPSDRVEDVAVRFAWRGPGTSSDRRATLAADVLSEILRQPGSRFQRRLVDTGLMIGVDAVYYTQRSHGVSSLTFRALPEKTKEAVRRAREELAALANPDYFTDEELANARAAVIRDELLQREDLIDYCHSIGFWWASAGTEYLQTRFAETRTIGRADIERYVKDYLHSPIFAAVAVVPDTRAGRAALTRDDLLTR